MLWAAKRNGARFDTARRFLSMEQDRPGEAADTPSVLQQDRQVPQQPYESPRQGSEEEIVVGGEDANESDLA